MPQRFYATVAGVERANGRLDTAARTLVQGVSIHDVADHQPTRATFQAMGFAPAVGERVVLSFDDGSSPVDVRLFAGSILSTRRSYLADDPNNQVYTVQCIDDTARLAAKIVIGQFTGDADAVVLELMALYAPEFTTTNVVAGLPAIEGGITFTNQRLSDCLTQIAKRIGGYWYLDYFGDLHFFLTETSNAPDDITNDHPTLRKLTITRDVSQTVTRVFVEGGGGNALSEVDAGETILPVENADWYNPAGGTVVSGAQRIDYTGVDLGGGGSLVGPGASPASAPVLGFANGSGMTAGRHDAAVVFVTGSGRSLPSPVASFEVGDVPAPTSAPSAGNPTAGGSVTAGDHYYAVTEVTPAGETTPSPVSNTVASVGQTADPVSALTFFPGGTSRFNGALDAGATYGYAYTYWDGGTRETLLSPLATTTLTNNSGNDAAGAVEIASVPTPPAGFQVRFYRTDGGGSTYKLLPSGQAYGQFSESASGYYIDIKADSTLGVTAPVTNNTAKQTILVSALPPASAFATDRKLYRTAAGGSQLKLLVASLGSAMSYSDTIADGSLGANAPSSAPSATQMAVSSIAIGPSGTTAREVYMSPAGGGARKRALTISDNATTTGTITMSDATLAGQLAEPVIDGSGLAQPTGQVLAGSTSLPVAGTSGFPSEGWAVIGNGQQVIRYTGITSGTTLTGIPASGAGAITATISYNSNVTAAPQLTGIPAGSPSNGSITYRIPKGEPVNLLVQADDTGAQATLGALMLDSDGNPTDGIVEAYLQDQRLSEAECRARGQAYLALYSVIQTKATYSCHDLKTRAGVDIVFDMTAPMEFAGTLKIQEVSISFLEVGDDYLPLFEVEASTTRFTFEDLLRQARE